MFACRRFSSATSAYFPTIHSGLNGGCSTMPTYPYSSSTGAITQTLDQLRKSFPSKVDAAYLQRFKIAPSNESYVIAIIRFLGLIDEEGNRQDGQVNFFHGSDDTFKAGLDALLRDKYAELFGEMGDGAYTADRESLGYWFRGADKTSDLVGGRQASTFLALGAAAGKVDGVVPPKPRAASTAKGGAGSKSPKPARASKTDPEAAASPVDVLTAPPGDARADVGLTVRIEVNLPAGGDADTYDAIFASIKRHLIS